MAVLHYSRIFRGSTLCRNTGPRGLFFSQTPGKCSKSDDLADGEKAVNLNPERESSLEDGVLEEPSNCCMSGCANCVWIQYAEELIKKVDGGGEKARQVILNRIQDPNMRAFLEMELRVLSK